MPNQWLVDFNKEKQMPKIKGASLSTDTSSLSWGSGRPTSRDAIKGHKASNIKNLGYSNFTSDRPTKVSLKGKGQK